MIQLIGRLGVRGGHEKWLHPLPGLGCEIGELLCVEPATASRANDLKYSLGPVILAQSFGDRINAIRELLYGLLGRQAKQESAISGAITSATGDRPPSIAKSPTRRPHTLFTVPTKPAKAA
jgi:hypothetical protein